MIEVLVKKGYPASVVCETLQVSRSGYYVFVRDIIGERQRTDNRLMPLVRKVFWEHKRRYGARRIAKELQSRGESCGPGRVAKLMKCQGLKAIQPKSFRPHTTDSNHRLGYSPHRLLDAPQPTECNRIWVGDITYIPLKGSKFAYLSMLLDLFSRYIVGWELSDHMKEPLVLASLRQAIRDRQPGPGLIHHTDRGGQYAGSEYRRVLDRAGALQSMNRADNCYDNAFMESCFGTIKTELEMAEYENRFVARSEVAAYINYYNTSRRHSSLDYMTPSEFEGFSASS